METFTGKICLAVAWMVAIVSGKAALFILSAIPSILATIYWIIKIRKELKRKTDVGKN